MYYSNILGVCKESDSNRKHVHEAVFAHVHGRKLRGVKVEVGWKWKTDVSGRPMEVEDRWKWKTDGSGRRMDVIL